MTEQGDGPERTAGMLAGESTEPSAGAAGETATGAITGPAGGTVTGSAGDLAERAETVLERAGTAVERAGTAVERAGTAVERAAAASGRVASAVVGRLRNDAELPVSRGTTRIEDEVVEKIAGIAARTVPGVHDLGGDAARFFASVKDRVGLGQAGKASQGVSARLEGRTAKITVTLMVEYGVKVYPVTEQVRTVVIEAVERMLDLQVTEVNLVVDDVQVPASGPAGAAG
jgi:uncharacterized alkaline shock family protein YloU